MPTQDYYQVLGVAENAAPDEIKAAYRRLAFQHHPDRNSDQAQAADKMKQLNEAYAVLSNAAKRHEYDHLRRRFGQSAHRHFRQAHSESDIFRDSDIAKVFEEMAAAYGYRGFEEVFRQFYGRGFRHFQYRGPGFAAKGFVFTRPFGGGTRQHPPVAGPAGKLARLLFGRIGGLEMPENGAHIKDTITLSPELAHSGGPYAYFHARRSKKLVIQIPPAVRNGQQVRLSGQGEAGRFGGRSGDLLLKVRIRKPLIARLKAFLGGK